MAKTRLLWALLCRVLGRMGSGWETARRSTRATTDPCKVFVIRGRNREAKNALYVLLREVNLLPLDWDEFVIRTSRGTPHVREVLDIAFNEAQAVVVLLTGDDEVRLRKEYLTENDLPQERRLQPQARPNVLFEAGRAFGSHPERTVLVSLGRIRSFSDIEGYCIVQMDNSEDRRKDLLTRLENAGCPVQWERTDWRSAGDFESSVIPYADDDLPGGSHPALDTHSRVILQILGRSSPEAVSEDSLKGQLDLPLGKVDHLITSLLESQYILPFSSTGEEDDYELTRKGKDYLTEQGLW